jgi:regulatory protein
MKTAYQHAIYLLSRQDYSIHKMREKLRLKEFEDEEINTTIDKLLEQNYLREEEYARMRTKMLLTKGYSNTYVIQKLNSEKLSTTTDDINTLREEQGFLIDDEVKKLIEKKLRNKEIPEAYEEKLKLKNKVLRFLISKGHSFHTASSQLNTYLESL